jgi:DNA-directed RNA polymerase specialized sigma24 family protein
MTDPRKALREARKRRERWQAEAIFSADGMRSAILSADAAGIPKTEIAELAGVSRQTVHSMLKQERGNL